MQPPPSEEITTEQKIEEFNNKNKNIQKGGFLDIELEEYIDEVEPNKPLSYYGTEKFYKKFLTWRLNKIKEIYNNVIKELKMTPQEQSRYRNQTVIYYSKHLDTLLLPSFIKNFVKYLLKIKPQIRDLDTPSFQKGLNEYDSDDEEEEI